MSERSTNVNDGKSSRTMVSRDFHPLLYNSLLIVVVIVKCNITNRVCNRDCNRDCNQPNHDSSCCVIDTSPPSA